MNSLRVLAARTYSESSLTQLDEARFEEARRSLTAKLYLVEGKSYSIKTKGVLKGLLYSGRV